MFGTRSLCCAIVSLGGSGSIGCLHSRCKYIILLSLSPVGGYHGFTWCHRQCSCSVVICHRYWCLCVNIELGPVVSNEYKSIIEHVAPGKSSHMQSVQCPLWACCSQPCPIAQTLARSIMAKDSLFMACWNHRHRHLSLIPPHPTQAQWLSCACVLIRQSVAVHGLTSKAHLLD